MQYDDAKKIVIKIGSALLVEQESGKVHQQWLTAFLSDVAQAVQQKKQIVLVSSGSIALGKRALPLHSAKLTLEIQQAAAAVGQIQLAHVYKEVLAKHDVQVAQVLLTLGDSENRQRFLNARNTIDTLLQFGVVPIINENDTVATAEICFGDNDRLAARVAQMIDADLLVLLSDIDGLYTADPNKDKNAQHIALVNELSPEILNMAADSFSNYGSGGMRTKLSAAKICMQSGCTMIIANGYQLNPLRRLQQGEKCTWFIPKTTPGNARKLWLAHHLQPLGRVYIDDGAKKALLNGKSLLAAGVISSQGDFRKGDPIQIMHHENEIARGLSNYPVHDLDKIIGRRSDIFLEILGYHGDSTVIHRNNMVILHKGDEIELN